MLSRLVMGSSPIISASLVRKSLQGVPLRNQVYRQFQRESRGETVFKTRSERVAERQGQSLKERAMGPPGPNAYAIGKGAAAGASVIGLGALCYYGLGLGAPNNTLNQSMLWPQYVKERIHSTYAYFGGSVALTAVSAAAIFRSPALFNLVSRGGLVSIFVSMAAMIGSGMVARSIPYEPGVGAKQLAWAVHCAIMGAVLAPLSMVGGQIIVRAAWYTAGIVGGLSTVAVCAPSDKFLYMGGPLAIGLGVVFASSLASLFLAPTTALGAGLYSLSLYGGLILFSGFLLYDTQRIVHKAENHPYYGAQPFDPVNNAISIYMDTLNIFIRIVSILAGGGGNRRK